MILKDLKKVIPYQWKIQSTGKDWKENKMSTQKWNCVAYIDARDCMDLLDEICWPANRQTRFKQVKNTMFCEVGILCWSEWIWKSDAWTEAPKEWWTDAQFKWEASDAFKRACVQRWIWRFLYDLEIERIAQKEYNDNKYKLTEFINWKKWINNIEKQATQKQEITIEQLEKQFAKVRAKVDAQEDYPSKPKFTATLSDYYKLNEQAFEAIDKFYSTILF